MSVKTMIFVDGSWLYHSRQALFDRWEKKSGFEIDYKRIPNIIAHEIADVLDAGLMWYAPTISVPSR